MKMVLRAGPHEIANSTVLKDGRVLPPSLRVSPVQGQTLDNPETDSKEVLRQIRRVVATAFKLNGIELPVTLEVEGDDA